jgi:hypothetical protein
MVVRMGLCDRHLNRTLPHPLSSRRGRHCRDRRAVLHHSDRASDHPSEILPRRSLRRAVSDGSCSMCSIKRASSTQRGRLSGRKREIQADDLHRPLRLPGFARATHEICSSDRASNRMLRATMLVLAALQPCSLLCPRRASASVISIRWFSDKTS